MRLTFLALAAVLALAAQDAPPDKEKPTPRKKARELLDRASESITATQPEVQVAGLIHIAELYMEFDRKKALTLFDQAFAASASLPTAPVDKLGYMQSQVIALAAEVDVDKATELLAQVPAPQSGKRDNRVRPIESIVSRLITEKKYDQAIQLITSMGSTGEFAYRAASSILRALSQDDPRRNGLFAAATTAYTARPAGPFTDFVSRHSKEVPQQLAESAVDAILRPLLTGKPVANYSRTISGARGSVNFDSYEDAELFNLFHVVQAVNPKRAAELLEKRIGLREALTKFPEGVQSMGNDISTSTTSGSARSAEDQGRQRLEALAQSLAIEARNAASKDIEHALSLADQVPLPSHRASTLASIAEGVAEKDPTSANAILTRCVKVMTDVKEPSQRADTWVRIARTAHRAKDDERARTALDKALDDATALYKQDVDPDAPNGALREYWPSTQMYRRIVHAATTMWEVDAESMLPRISDPEINQLVTIEMARALLKKPSRADSTMTDRRRK